jgi:hypothetical protein
MPRILIGALSGWKYLERRQRCLSTWMADGEALDVRSVFLLGCPTIERPEQIGPHALALPCPDDYPSLPQRTNSFCRWACEQPGWDYLFKCDDDTYISMPRLTAYDPADPATGCPRDYIGAEWQPGVGYGSGGAGYLLSLRAAAIVAERLHATPTGAEDLLVGRLLAAAGIPLSIERRLVPFGSMDRRPRRENDLITLHGVEADAFLASHAETGLWSAATCRRFLY